ncbi:transposase [Klebsiella quasipneumoniae]|uniref:transposase n=1 Tax=Klebsiella quasipneumoniae TaxID=1463165 RepID=UPI00388D632F
MKSLTAVRKKSPNYPVEFKIKMVELSHRPEISVAQLAREHGINDNLLFCSSGASTGAKENYVPSTTENNVPELLPITLDAEDVVPTTSPGHNL